MSQTDFVKSKMRAGLVTATAMALIIGPFMSAAQARAKVGVASAVIPQARLGDELGELEIISVGDRVDQDVIIETGKRGRTQVLFIDGSSMNIGPASRIVIDEFVFDPKELDGNLGARIEKGSMRFIGGVLSKRGKQVKFNAGDATVGIRGGIAKLALDEKGALKAELVHGRLSVETPEGIFETARIGTLIERDETGAVNTRSVTPEETKATLDEEAAEAFVEPEAAPLATAPDDVDTPAEASSDTPAEATAETTAETTADPVDAGLVEVDEDGNLKATQALVEADPEAAKLIDEGAIALDESGTAAPTEKMLELDETAKKMFDEGLLEIDDNGFLVPSDDFDPEALYAEFQNDDVPVELVSEVTLAEFELEAPSELAFEAEYLEKRAAVSEVFKADTELASFYDQGLVEVDANGNIKTSDDFKAVFTSTLTRPTTIDFETPQTFIDDSGADKFLLETGVFDTKITTRVLGAERATSLYSADVTRVVSRDIVRENTVDAISKLAAANEIKVSEDFKTQDLEKLVAVGNDLSNIDRMRAVLGEEKIDTTGLTIEFAPEVNDAPSTNFSPEATISTKSYELKNADGEVADFSDAPALSLRDLYELESKGVSVTEIAGILGGVSVISTGGEAVYFPEEVVKAEDSPAILDDLFVPATEEAAFDPATEEAKTDIAGADDTAADPIETRDDRIAVTDDFKPEDPVIDDFKTDDFNTADFEPDYGSGYETDTGSYDAGGYDSDYGDEYDTGGFDTGSDFGKVVDGEFGDASGPTTYPDNTVVTDSKVEDNYIDEKDFYIDVEDTGKLVRDTQEDVTKDELEPVAYNLYVAGARASTSTRTLWGSSGPDGVWDAYSTLGDDQYSGVLMHEADGTMMLRFYATTQNDDRTRYNNVELESTKVSETVKDVLAHGSPSFAAAMTAAAGIRGESFTVSKNEAATAKLSQTEMAMTHVATGLWKDGGFADRAFDNIQYQHVGHYAIGAPLSPDTIQELAGMTATFSGTAYGTMVNARGSAEGAGNVRVQVDYANRGDTGRNFWQLSSFRTRSGTYTQSGNITVPLAHGADGRYFGAMSDAGIRAQVDGGVHGVYKQGGANTLETAGAFAVNDANNNVAISGAYVATNASVTASPR